MSLYFHNASQCNTVQASKIKKKSEARKNMRKVIKLVFSDKYLFFTNVTISATFSSIGDVLEQTYEVYSKEQDIYSVKRTLHMGFSGVALGTLGHHWYKILDKIIVGKTFQMMTKKLLLEQLFFSPVIILTLFGSLAILEDNPAENFQSELKNKFLTLYKADWLVWPPAQVVSFYFLPTRYRVLYDNTISLGYDVYTSRVKHSNTNINTEK